MPRKQFLQQRLDELEECTVCFKIVCRQCKWEPSDEEVVAIQNGELTACPNCGWIPGI